jgi:hypothetical protein
MHVDLEPGSLLLMSYETQLHYTHGIPKTQEEVGPSRSYMRRRSAFHSIRWRSSVNQASAVGASTKPGVYAIRPRSSSATARSTDSKREDCWKTLSGSYMS